MSADRLREAAAKVRALAEAATPAREWTSDILVVGNHHHEDDAAYIAAMSPPVALALAGAMNQHAAEHDLHKCRRELCQLAVAAHAILGGAA